MSDLKVSETGGTGETSVEFIGIFGVPPAALGGTGGTGARQPELLSAALRRALALVPAADAKATTADKRALRANRIWVSATQRHPFKVNRAVRPANKKRAGRLDPALKCQGVSDTASRRWGSADF